MYDQDTIFECTNPECGWQGKDDERAEDFANESGLTDIVCPECCNDEFFLLK